MQVDTERRQLYAEAKRQERQREWIYIYIYTYVYIYIYIYILMHIFFIQTEIERRQFHIKKRDKRDREKKQT